ncbi:hypothetical protein AKO1_006404 [Acrasis kona]|uniref:Tetratricopeptide repeat protein n=1 Tax=Acrasis kona TaxID=1008807 RepID=A0AAW2YIE0_9EUKA
MEEAQNMIVEERYDECLLLIENNLASYPGDGPSLVIKGRALERLCRYEEAITCFNTAVEVSPVDVLAYEGLATCYMLLKQYQPAIEASNTALRLGSDGCLMQHIKGSCLCKLEKYDEAVLAFDTYLLKDPNHVSTLYNKGIVLCSASRNKQAELCFDKVLQNNPKHLKTLISKGTLISERDRPKALDYFNQALEIDPKNVGAIYSKALLLIKMDQAVEAVNVCERALRDENDLAKYYSPGTPTPIVQSIQPNNVLHVGGLPNQSMIILAKGRALFKMKIFEQALLCFEECSYGLPNEPSVLYLKSQCLFELNKPLEAQQCLDRTFTLDPKFDVSLFNL